MREGKHGHYETMFRIVREEVERDREFQLEMLVALLTAIGYSAGDREYIVDRIRGTW